MKSDDFETRRLARLRRLGSSNPVCVVCGEDDDRCLEKHHITYGQLRDEVAIICRNCHRKLSDAQKDQPPLTGDPVVDEVLYAIGRFLLGLADLFALLVETLREFGEHLIARARGSIEGGAQ
jgi:hypothetical protein